MAARGRLVMKWLYLFLILALPFGQLQRIPVSLKQLPEINLYLTDLISLAILAFWGIKLIKKQAKPPRESRYFGLFFAITAISLSANVSWLGIRNAAIASLYLIRLIAYSSIYFALPSLKLSAKKAAKIIPLLYWAGTLVAIFGLLQYVLYPDIRPLNPRGWDPHLYRVVSLFLDPGFTGLILALSLTIAIENIIHRSKGILHILPVLLLYPALILTYSRSSYLAFTAAAAFIFFSQKKRHLFWLFLLFFSATLLIIPHPAGEGVKLERTSTIEARIQSYREGIDIFLKRPVLGVGFNSYRYAQNKFHHNRQQTLANRGGSSPDSSLILILATTGIVGLISFSLIVLKIIAPFFRKIQEPTSNLILASLITIAVHSLFLNSLFYPAVMIWLFVLLGIGETMADNKP